MNSKDNSNLNNPYASKPLPEVFKELENARYGVPKSAVSNTKANAKKEKTKNDTKKSIFNSKKASAQNTVLQVDMSIPQYIEKPTTVTPISYNQTMVLTESKEIAQANKIAYKESLKAQREQAANLERQAKEQKMTQKAQAALIKEQSKAKKRVQKAEEVYAKKQTKAQNKAQKAANKSQKRQVKTVKRRAKRTAKQISKEKMQDYVTTRAYKDPVAIGFIAAIAILGGVIIHNAYHDFREDSKIAVVTNKKEIVGGYEKNYQTINISQVLEQNLQTTETKELITITRDVAFLTEYTENPKLPKDEQMITQEGVVGQEEVTFIRTYANSDVVNDNVISINTLTTPVIQKIDVGTNEQLAKLKAHLGDTLYVKESTPLRVGPDNTSQEIGTLVQYYDVELLDITSNWAQIRIFDYVGYCDSSKLASSAQDSSLPDKCRRQKIVKGVNENMALNQVSGLSSEDYAKIFSGNSSDRYKIFEQNAQVFYNMEQKYKINGIFLASIGIHESGWGTSTISQNKKNLFGYGSYDSDPYNMSFTFDTYAEGIELVARSLVKYYINVPGTPIFDNQYAVGSYYNGPTVQGVNTRYASDNAWHTKVYSTMVKLYTKIAP